MIDECEDEKKVPGGCKRIRIWFYSFIWLCLGRKNMDLGDYLRAAMIFSSVKTSADGNKQRIVGPIGRSSIIYSTDGPDGNSNNTSNLTYFEKRYY